MKKCHLIWTILFSILLSINWVTANAQGLDDVKLSLPDSAIAVDVVTTFSCPGPKPKNIGCTTVCKPCKTYVCVNGAWVPTDLDWPDRLCESRPGTGGGGNVCVGTDTGFCPAECSSCM